MTEYPEPPALTKNGAYDPGDLSRYFKEADAAKMGEAMIARHLRVAVHRIVYMRARMKT